MELVHNHLHPHADTSLPVLWPVDLLTTAKRRWRETAAGSGEFGWDLEHPLGGGHSHGHHHGH
jgi:hypothetical protein